MKIAVISTTTYETPPRKYGGEYYFWLIAKGLAELGHRITLYATPKSKTPPNGELRLIPSTYGRIDIGSEARVWKMYGEELLEHDFIIDCSHNHIPAEQIRFFHPEAMNRIVNVLNGVCSHVPRPEPFNLIVGSESWKECLIKGISQFYGTPWAEYGEFITPVKPEAIVGVIPWAIDVKSFPFEKEKEDYFLWFSRPTPYKGLHVAIKLARKLGLKLKVALPIAAEDHRYWFEKYKPMIESSNAEVVTNPTHEQKIELMSKAKALIFSIESREPFGLIPVETMACGTPVIATKIGAMPEIIKEGGILCSNFDEFVKAVERIDEVKPKDARRNAERYDYRRVVPKYLEVLECLS
ncbi:MAG: glycosyltransferase [Methermicoccaceae archaeon]